MHLLPEAAEGVFVSEKRSAACGARGFTERTATRPEHHRKHPRSMMNKQIYSLVWNKSLKQIVVASELATAKGGSSSAGCASGDRQGGWRRSGLVAALTVALGLMPLAAFSATHAQVADQHAGAANSVATANAAVNASGVTDARNSRSDTAAGQFAIADSDDDLGSLSTAIGYTAFPNIGAATISPASPMVVNPGSSAHYFDANGPMDGSDDASATGAVSVAAGSNASASGDDSSALGASSTASGKGASALGNNAYASGDGSTAVGQNSTASGLNATAVG